jgi:hypothetical protein
MPIVSKAGLGHVQEGSEGREGGRQIVAPDLREVR